MFCKTQWRALAALHLLYTALAALHPKHSSILFFYFSWDCIPLCIFACFFWKFSFKNVALQQRKICSTCLKCFFTGYTLKKCFCTGCTCLQLNLIIQLLKSMLITENCAVPTESNSDAYNFWKKKSYNLQYLHDFFDIRWKIYLKMFEAKL